jgi:hypothetical protein
VRDLVRGIRVQHHHVPRDDRGTRRLKGHPMDSFQVILLIEVGIIAIGSLLGWRRP